MTATETWPSPTAAGRLFLTPAGAGFLLGFLDFVWIKYVPSPLGGLGNSSAVWAVAAFLLAYGLRGGRLAGILGGVILLVVAVPSYYLAAALIQSDRLGALWSPLWTTFGVLAGVVFGAAGAAARRPDRWQVPALAAPVAVLFAEAGLLLARLADPSYGSFGLAGQALLEVGLGLVVLLLVRLGWSRRAAALALAAPFAVVGFALFKLAGFA